MDMPMILDVIRHPDGKRTSIKMAISADLDVFKGHFIGMPVVPGVAQIYWALELANLYLRPLSPLSVAGMEAIKFQQVITPDCEVLLELELASEKLLFVFSSPTQRYSSGKVVVSA